MTTTQRRLSAMAVVLALFACGCAPSVIDLALEIPHFEARVVTFAGDDHADAARALEERLTAWGIRIIAYHPATADLGMADIELRAIFIHPSLSLNGRLQVLAHEGGHFLQPMSAWGDLAVSQVFAQLVSHGVCRYYGLTDELMFANYLAGYKHALASERYLRRDIQFAVEALTGRRPLPPLHPRAHDERRPQ